MTSADRVPAASGRSFLGQPRGLYSEDVELVHLGSLGAVTMGIGVVLLALAPTVTRAMRGVR